MPPKGFSPGPVLSFFSPAFDPSFPVVHFLARNAMRKRGLCCRPVAVRPSVRPSVYQLAHCIQMAEDTVKLLSQPGNPIILVFDPQRWYPIPGEPLQPGRKIHGVGKLCDFRPKPPIISEAARDRPMVATER